jgi:hypothetical protein
MKDAERRSALLVDGTRDRRHRKATRKVGGFRAVREAAARVT